MPILTLEKLLASGAWLSVGIPEPSLGCQVLLPLTSSLAGPGFTMWEVPLGEKNFRTETWVQILAPPMAGCVASAKFLPSLSLSAQQKMVGNHPHLGG
jgi:hypothetical protein